MLSKKELLGRLSPSNFGLANLRLAQAFADVCECTTGDAAQPACCVLGLALFIDPASLEFRKPSAEFGQLGRREPQDRFFDIFDCHGRRNSTPALELEEQWPANRDVITVFRQPVNEVGKLGPLPPAETDCVAGHAGLELRNVVANYPFERSHRFAGIQPKLATETIRV